MPWSFKLGRRYGRFEGPEARGTARVPVRDSSVGGCGKARHLYPRKSRRLRSASTLQPNGFAAVVQSLQWSARVHVKWVEACTVRDGQQAGVLVEGDVSPIHVVDSVVVGNRGHALLAMDTWPLGEGEGEGVRETLEPTNLGPTISWFLWHDADDVKCCWGGLVSRTADTSVSSRVPHTLT